MVGGVCPPDGPGRPTRDRLRWAPPNAAVRTCRRPRLTKKARNSYSTSARTAAGRLITAW